MPANEETKIGHTPKTGALVAYESGALSQRGRRRVEKHLSGCETCRRELAAIQMYDESVDVIRDARLPRVDWSKMELALEREARAQIAAKARTTRRAWLVPAAGIALAAAAVLAISLWPHAPEAPVAAEDHAVRGDADGEPATPPTPERDESLGEMAMNGQITLVAGAAHVTSDGAAASAAEGGSLGRGASLRTDQGGTVHAVLASPSPAGGRIGIALASASELRVVSLDATEASLALGSGRVSVRTRSARTVVLAGEYRIEADVAWFTVDLSPSGAVQIDVSEGDVRVTGPSTDRSLLGPAQFSAPDGAAASLTTTDPVGMADGYGALPRLHVARPEIVRWQIGDVDVLGAGELAMRVGTGEISITGWDSHEREFHAMASVGPGGLDLSPSDLRPEAPRVRVGTLPTAVIQGVVSSHHASLQRCYERALRQQSDLAVHVEMQITVDMTGEVSRVRLSGDEVPAMMSSCLTRDVESWTFPAPDGGPMTFVLPNTFAPR